DGDDVHAVGVREHRPGHGVGDDLRQRAAVVGQGRVEDVAAVQVDAGAVQVDRAGAVRVGAVDVQAGRVVALAAVVEQVELDGDAVADPLVAQAAAGGPQLPGVVGLQREGEPVGAGVGELEVEAGGERRGVHRAGGERAGRLAGVAVGQPQPRAADGRR